MILVTELLAIQLAMEKWRHWLEGANHPFTVVTDHKNQKDSIPVKPTGSITYWPGNCNCKADALHECIHQIHPQNLS